MLTANGSYIGKGCLGRNFRRVEILDVSAFYSAAYPKSFTSVRRNRPAHADESSQWRARSETCGLTGDSMTISGYLAATALVAVILWAVLGLLMQES